MAPELRRLEDYRARLGLNPVDERRDYALLGTVAVISEESPVRGGQMRGSGLGQ